MVLKKCPDLSGLRHGVLKLPRRFVPFDVLILASSRLQAQNVAMLLHAAEAVEHGCLPMSGLLGVTALIPPTAVPRRTHDLEGLDPDLAQQGLAAVRQSGGMETVIRLAANASQRRSWQYALLKLYHSMTLVGVEMMDTHPKYYEPGGFIPSRWTNDHVRYTAAVTYAYAAIEELRLTVNAVEVNGTKRARLDDGTWVPAVLADIEARLAQAHVQSGEGFLWHRRGALRRHERSKKIRASATPRWSRGPIRDVCVSFPDALDHVRYLRNQVSGHRIDDRGRSLTALDVANVQGLARALIFSTTRSWWPAYQPWMLKDRLTEGRGP